MTAGDLILDVSRNGGAGGDNGSETQIDNRDIGFASDAGGATVGNVIDVAPGS